MKTLYNLMQKKEYNIPNDILLIFKDIIEKGEAKNEPSLDHNCKMSFFKQWRIISLRNNVTKLLKNTAVAWEQGKTEHAKLLLPNIF